MKSLVQMPTRTGRSRCCSGDRAGHSSLRSGRDTAGVLGRGGSKRGIRRQVGGDGANYMVKKTLKAPCDAQVALFAGSAFQKVFAKTCFNSR